MKIVVVKPGQPAEIRDIEGSLESMQEVVGGDIQVLYPWTSSICLVCNEDARRLNFKPNKVILFTDRFNNLTQHQKLIRGTFFIVGLSDDGDFRGLDLEEAAHIRAYFGGKGRI